MMELELSPLRDAVKCLDDSVKIVHDPEKTIDLDSDVRNLLRSGVIHYFKVTYELCVKFLDKYLENNLGSGCVVGISRKELFRIALEHRLIKNVEHWLDYNKARNLTSRSYREDYANDVFRAAENFIPDAKYLVEALEKRKDFCKNTLQ
jgi:nucleotidyltransferase substrate binding protein (TIGR01987 family)